MLGIVTNSNGVQGWIRPPGTPVGDGEGRTDPGVKPESIVVLHVDRADQCGVNLRGSGARPPVGKKDAEVAAVDVTIAVQVTPNVFLSGRKAAPEVQVHEADLPIPPSRSLVTGETVIGRVSNADQRVIVASTISPVTKVRLV